MSLYGSGRREGITAVLLIVALVSFVHVFGMVRSQGLDGIDWLVTLRTAAWPALAGVLCYRFLRAMGRSRFTGFLTGSAYALSPWLTAMSLAPREQLAAVLAPLALEAVWRCDNPAWRRTWLPWTGLCLGVPFVAGPTVIAWCCAAICAVQIGRVIALGDLGERIVLARRVLVAAALGAVAAASFAWLDAFAPAFGSAAAPTSIEVLAAHRSPAGGIDVSALLRLAGPVLFLFAALGIARRQRHASIRRWLLIGCCGALPTVLAAWLPFSAWSQLWSEAPLLPAASWWLLLLAICVLSAAGLDDFLDLPLRRRTALPWLLAAAVLVAPLVPVASVAPEREWPLTATIVLLAILLPTWRKVGILRFKNALATVVVLALAVPTLQVLLIAPPCDLPAAPAMPAGEVAPFRAPSLWDELRSRPPWHYSGLIGVLVCSLFAAVSAWRRNRNARPVPSSAKAAITKKARPPQRS